MTPDQRLLVYRAYAVQRRSLGQERVVSWQIAQFCGWDASQVRRDLLTVEGLKGVRGLGYLPHDVVTAIDAHLGELGKERAIVGLRDLDVLIRHTLLNTE